MGTTTLWAQPEILRRTSKIYYAIHLHSGYNSITVALGEACARKMPSAKQTGSAPENRVVKMDAHMGSEPKGVFAAALRAATRF